MPVNLSPSTTCPHYLHTNYIPGQAAYCRGCGALIVQANATSATKIAAYPGIVGAPGTNAGGLKGKGGGHSEV
jgi:hypothetical protein